jgi:hypothetical protein
MQQCCQDQEQVAEMIKLAKDAVGCTSHPDGLLPPRPVAKAQPVAQPVAHSEQQVCVADVHVRVTLNRGAGGPSAVLGNEGIAVLPRTTLVPRPRP